MMEETFNSGGVRGVMHRPEKPGGGALALTHGAGSNSNAPLLVSLARGFAGAGLLVLRYDLPFRQLRAGGSPHPSGAARDRDGVAQAVAAIRALAPGPIYAGGHSYGGRQTAMAAAERPGLADALLLLSYPLHPPAKPEQKRTGYFPDLRVPALFVHGAKDPFGTPEELRVAIAAIPARTDVLLVEGAGHDLKKAASSALLIWSRLQDLLGSRQ